MRRYNWKPTRKRIEAHKGCLLYESIRLRAENRPYWRKVVKARENAEQAERLYTKLYNFTNKKILLGGFKPSRSPRRMILKMRRHETREVPHWDFAQGDHARQAQSRLLQYLGVYADFAVVTDQNGKNHTYMTRRFP